MVDLDHCSYATIWAGDKDCYRGNICYLSVARSFFLSLLLLSPPLDPHCLFLPLSVRLFSTLFIQRLLPSLPGLVYSSPCRVLHLSCCALCPPPPTNPPTHPPTPPPQSSPLCLLISPPSLHLCALNLVLRDCLCLPAGLAPV